MKIVIFGAGEGGKAAAKEILKYSDLELVGFLDNYKKGMAYGYSILNIEDVCKNAELNVVISVGAPFQIERILKQLKKNGKKECFLFLKKDFYKGDFLTNDCAYISLNHSDCRLVYAEMHITDFCNLNCKGCTHFSPLFEKKFPSLDMRIQDVKTLRSLFPHIIRFNILGGEPLLNPELEKYIIQIRQILPETEISVVTNGLLIPSLPLSTFEILRKNKINISISVYEPTKRILNTIRELLEKNEIFYDLRAYEKKQKFNKPLSLSSKSIHPHACISDHCINICDGKVSRCPTLLFINKFNKTFGTSLPTQGIYKLEEIRSGDEFLGLMNQSVPLCSHCVRVNMEWEQCGKNPSLTDFAVDD